MDFENSSLDRARIVDCRRLQPRSRASKRRIVAAPIVGNAEASVEDLLNDPIAELLRRRDKLTLQEVWDCVEDGRRRLRARQRPLER
jgi:hypothetical protein